MAEQQVDDPRDGERHPSVPGTSARRPAGGRVVALDVVRGFALVGIVVANVKPITGGTATAPTASATDVVPSVDWVHLLVDQRFFPIFALLFGIGFSLLLESAAARTARPRLVLVRRLLILLVLGLAHRLLWAGDILTVYAVVGLVVLVPSTWLPRRAVAWLACGLLVAALATGAGQFALVPGLFLLGSAATRFGVLRRVERSRRASAVVAAGLALSAAPVLWVQAQLETSGDAGSAAQLAYHLAGLMLAGAYVATLLALLGTPLARILRAALEPLGRMALTNYVLATVLVLGAARATGATGSWDGAEVLLVAGAVVLLQWAASRLWLRHHAQGPLEWLWRWGTWLRRPGARPGTPVG
jgi:uncharacterized protein